MYLNQKKISIIGQGFIGLPMALVLSNVKKNKRKIYKVYGIEKNDIYGMKILKSYQKKKLWIDSDDKKLNKIFLQNVKKNFLLSTDFSSIETSEVVIVSIGFDFTKSNSLKNLKKIIKEVFSIIKEDKMLIIETTLPPGTCDKELIPIAKSIFKKRKLNFDKFSFCYSFERITPGKNYINSIININRVYSANSLKAKNKCKKFLKTFINHKSFKLTCLKNIIDAEATKVFENSYRAVNIALIDEWVKFSEKLKINLNSSLKAIRLRSTHNNIRYPGIGVGGYCLTKDPLFLEYSIKKIFKKTCNLPITNTAVSINKKMVNYSVNFLERKIIDKKEKKILIVGLAYKDSVSDVRNSPSLELIKQLKNKNYKIYFYDNLISSFNEFKILRLKKGNFKFIKNIIFCQKTDFFSNHKRILMNNQKNFIDLNNVLSHDEISKIEKTQSRIHLLGGR